MPENIKELRKICQGDKGKGRGILYFIFCRSLSIYLTKILLKTKITPNQVTIFSILTGIIGVLLIFLNTVTTTIIGLFLIYLWLFLDKVDGEIARYKNLHSIQGIYLDQIAHMLIVPTFFFATGYIAYLETSSNPALFLGFTSALFPLLVRFEYKLPYQIFAQRAIRNPTLLNKIKNQTQEKSTTKPKTIINISSKLSDEYLKILILFIAFIADFFITTLNLKLIALSFFTIIYLTFFLHNTYSSYKKSLDKKTKDIYQLTKEKIQNET